MIYDKTIIMKKIVTAIIILLYAFIGYSQTHCGGSNKCLVRQAKKANEELALTTSEMIEYKSLHIPYGQPRSSWNDDVIILIQKEYVTGYDTILKLPVWVSYLLTANWANDERKRKDCFRDDPRLYPDGDQHTCDIYSGSGFDRGHLAARDDFNRSRNAQLNTYLFSNIVPQFPNHNQSTWKHLEEYINNQAESSDSIYVMTGIIFDYDGDGKPDDKASLSTISNSRPLAVPSHMYKILLKKYPGDSVSVLAIMTPHDNLRRKKVMALNYIQNSCLSSVDQIEKASGFNFYWLLENEMEDKAESFVPVSLWE